MLQDHVNYVKLICAYIVDSILYTRVLYVGKMRQWAYPVELCFPAETQISHDQRQLSKVVFEPTLQIISTCIKHILHPSAYSHR
jgi:hypothetical protein